MLVQDAYELKKKFVIHFLKYYANEVEDVIHVVAQEYPRGVKEECLLINEG
jgi:hypothetical protein